MKQLVFNFFKCLSYISWTKNEAKIVLIWLIGMAFQLVLKTAIWAVHFYQTSSLSDWSDMLQHQAFKKIWSIKKEDTFLLLLINMKLKSLSNIYDTHYVARALLHKKMYFFLLYSFFPIFFFFSLNYKSQCPCVCLCVSVYPSNLCLTVRTRDFSLKSAFLKIDNLEPLFKDGTFFWLKF